MTAIANTIAAQRRSQRAMARPSAVARATGAEGEERLSEVTMSEVGLWLRETPVILEAGAAGPRARSCGNRPHLGPEAQS
jgi:hypothetical protein